MPDGWFVAPALLKLNAEIKDRWPDRDTESDGTIGNPDHQARESDHNPAWDEPPPFRGIVRASDRDDDGWPALDVQAFILARCRSGAEKRLWYLIHNRTIYSRTYGWEPRTYQGDNPHETHIHFNLAHDGSNFDDSPWLEGFGAGEDNDMANEGPEILSIVKDLHGQILTRGYPDSDDNSAVPKGQKTVGGGNREALSINQGNVNKINALQTQVDAQSKAIEAQSAKLDQMLQILQGGQP